jgi:uncharacterized DUF497 family protein
VKFEWDENKNEQNVKKHGFDFADEHEMFSLPMLVGVDRRESFGEARFVGIGFLQQRIAVIVFSQPEDDTIRVISLRKALKYERERFGQFLTDELGTD